MGDTERRDSRRVLEGKTVWPKSFRFSEWLLGILLYPYRAYKEKKRREEIRKGLLDGVELERPVQEVKLTKEQSSDWINDLLSEENKGE